MLLLHVSLDINYQSFMKMYFAIPDPELISNIRRFIPAFTILKKFNILSSISSPQCNAQTRKLAISHAKQQPVFAIMSLHRWDFLISKIQMLPAIKNW